MNRKERLAVDELLARGSLGGPQYEEIFRNVIRRSAPSRLNARLFVRRLILPLAAVAVSLCLWFATSRPAHDGFQAKGSDESFAPGAVSVGCDSAQMRRCRTGQTLMFTVNTALVSGFVEAYAERVGDPKHRRIQYFPNHDGLAPFVGPGSGTTLIPNGVRIGSEHSPGHYRVVVAISSRPPRSPWYQTTDIAPNWKIDLDILP